MFGSFLCSHQPSTWSNQSPYGTGEEKEVSEISRLTVSTYQDRVFCTRMTYSAVLFGAKRNFCCGLAIKLCVLSFFVESRRKQPCVENSLLNWTNISYHGRRGGVRLVMRVREVGGVCDGVCVLGGGGGGGGGEGWSSDHSLLTISCEETFEGNIPSEWKPKSDEEMKKRHQDVFGMPHDIDILALGSLAITLGDHVIRNMGLQQAGTGETFHSSLFISGVLRVEKLWKVKVWNSVIYLLLASLPIVIHLPNDFLHPRCACNQGKHRDEHELQC